MTTSENHHVENAHDWMTPCGEYDEPSEFAMQSAQVEATLALAYEQRTANLIALYVSGSTDIDATVHGVEYHALATQIKERLGL